jgi:hypothetical protein
MPKAAAITLMALVAETPFLINGVDHRPCPGNLDRDSAQTLDGRQGERCLLNLIGADSLDGSNKNGSLGEPAV